MSPRVASRRSRDRLLWCGICIPVVLFAVLFFAAHRHSASLLDRALVKAVEQDDVEAVHALLARGANPNARFTYENPVRSAADAVDWVIHSEKVFWHDAPVLVEAVDDLNAVPIIEALLDAGADINGRDVYGCTALMAAARTGASDLVCLLLNRGAEPTLRDKEGRTAEQWTHPDARQVLAALRKGATR